MNSIHLQSCVPKIVKKSVHICKNYCEKISGTFLCGHSICTSDRRFTRSDQKSTAAEINKSAITDHIAKENRVINWSGVKILERKGHRKTRYYTSRNRSGSGENPTEWTEMETDSPWPSFGDVLNITWPQAWWSWLLASEMAQLIRYLQGCVYRISL